MTEEAQPAEPEGENAEGEEAAEEEVKNGRKSHGLRFVSLVGSLGVD